MDKVRFGIIGLGNMGSGHLSYFKTVEGATIAAICDLDASKFGKFKKEYPDAATFTSHKDLLNSGKVDAILIAVPHYDHMPIAMDAFEKGINVLCEKPIA